MLPCIPIVRDIIDGMDLLNIMPIIRKNAAVFKSIFCPSCQFDWNFDSVEEAFISAARGHPAKRLRLIVTKHFWILWKIFTTQKVFVFFIKPFFIDTLNSPGIIGINIIIFF